MHFSPETIMKCGRINFRAIAKSQTFPSGTHVHADAVRRDPSVTISKRFCRRLRLLPKPPTVKTFPGSPQVAPPNSAGKVTPPAREMAGFQSASVRCRAGKVAFKLILRNPWKTLPKRCQKQWYLRGAEKFRKSGSPVIRSARLFGGSPLSESRMVL